MKKPDFLAYNVNDLCYGFRITNGAYCANCRFYRQFYESIDVDLMIIVEYDIIKRKIVHAYYSHIDEALPSPVANSDIEACKSIAINNDLDFTLPLRDFYKHLGRTESFMSVAPYTSRIFYLLYGLFTEERFLG